MFQPAAAIDLGTNTARLLIGTVEPDNRPRPVMVRRIISRLGGGFTRELGISREAWDRTLAALGEFSREMAAHGVGRYRAVATSAVRDALNGPEFCAEVLRETGILLDVIDGHEEGLLTLKGVLSGLAPVPERLLVFDIGGGSTEFTLSTGGEPAFSVSLPLGVVRLTEGKGEPAAMREKIERELVLLESMFADRNLTGLLLGSTLVGTAGTATTLAAISLRMTDYRPELINNHVVSLEEVREIHDRLIPLAPAERLLVPGMEKGREDLIVAGLLLTLGVMERFGFDSLTVSDNGLLEGILLSPMEHVRR